MNRDTKILAVFAVLLVMAIFGTFMVAYLASQPPQSPFQRQPQINPIEFDVYVTARTVFSVINITLLVVLILTYASIYLKTRSQFTIGLLLFAGVFLIKDVASSPLLPGAFRLGLFGFGPFTLWFVLLPDIFELVALAVLMYLSVRY